MCLCVYVFVCPDLRIECRSPALQADSLPLELPEKPLQAHCLLHFPLLEVRLFTNYAKPFVISNACGSQKKEKKNVRKTVVEFQSWSTWHAKKHISKENKNLHLSKFPLFQLEEQPFIMFDQGYSSHTNPCCTIWNCGGLTGGKLNLRVKYISLLVADVFSET